MKDAIPWQNYLAVIPVLVGYACSIAGTVAIVKWLWKR